MAEQQAGEKITASTPEEFLTKVLTAEENPPKEDPAPKPVLEGDDAPAPGEPPSGEESESQGEPASEPPIEPPSFWTAEEKARWTEIPRAAQEVIAAKEARRDAETRQRLDEIAGKRAEAEAERKAVLDGRAQLIQQQEAALQTLFPELQQLSQVDWQTLAATDPTEYVKYKAQADALQMKIGQIQGYIGQLNKQQSDDLAKIAKERSASEKIKLAASLPVFADPVKGKETAQKLNDWLKKQGFSDEEVSGIADHRTIKVIYKAWLADQTEEARKAAQAKQQKVAPKVVKPGQAQEPETRDAKRVAGKMGALKKHGTMDAAASFLEEIL